MLVLGAVYMSPANRASPGHEFFFLVVEKEIWIYVRFGEYTLDSVVPELRPMLSCKLSLSKL